MASGLANSIMSSLQTAPLGMGDNEGNITTPFNRGSELIRVRARNLSATRERNVYAHELVSWVRGGVFNQDAIKKEIPGFSLERARAESFAGMDPNKVVRKKVPVNTVFSFNGEKYLVPFEDEGGGPAPWVDLPEGLYDLYCGNYNRMHSSDLRERANEIEMLSMRRGNKDKNVALVPGTKNEWGYIEFEREVMKPMSIAFDADRIYGDTMVEV